MTLPLSAPYTQVSLPLFPFLDGSQLLCLRAFAQAALSPRNALTHILCLFNSDSALKSQLKGHFLQKASSVHDDNDRVLIIHSLVTVYLFWGAVITVFTIMEVIIVNRK